MKTEHETLCRLSSEYHKHGKIYDSKSKNPRKESKNSSTLYWNMSNASNFSKCEVQTSLTKILYCSLASFTYFEDGKR